MTGREREFSKMDEAFDLAAARWHQFEAMPTHARQVELEASLKAFRKAREAAFPGMRTVAADA